MLLALDVGNTNITAGAFQGGRLAQEWRVPTDVRLGGEKLGALIAARARRAGIPVDATALASVVPVLDAGLARSLKRYFRCEVKRLTPMSRLGIRLLVDRPGEVGADRIANALAAAELYGAPAVVIDFGTATTFDCVSRRGDYLGGAILPGPNMAARALAEFTAKLPRVAVARPRRVIGKNTVECIQAGLYHGYLGMIERVLRLTLAEMQAPRARILATGGLSRLFARDLPGRARMAPDLTLQGVRLAFEKMAGL